MRQRTCSKWRRVIKRNKLSEATKLWTPLEAIVVSLLLKTWWFDRQQALSCFIGTLGLQMNFHGRKILGRGSGSDRHPAEDHWLASNLPKGYQHLLLLQQGWKHDQNSLQPGFHLVDQVHLKQCKMVQRHFCLSLKTTETMKSRWIKSTV